MNCVVYKKREQLLYQRNQERSKYERCDISPKLEQKVLSLRNDILASFTKKNPEIFFKSIIKLNHIFNRKETIAIKIINIIWIPQFGDCLLDSIRTLQSVDETFTSQYISNNLLLIATLLKDSEVQKFYSNSTLSLEALKMYSISDNNINIIEQSIHVLVKTCKYYEHSVFPFNDIMPIVKSDNKSSTCERYIVRYLKHIVAHLPLSSIIVKKICDIFYFILRNPKSKRSLKHMMHTLYIFIRYDPINYINLIIESKIISQFMRIYSEKFEDSIYTSCPCFLIPFLEFIKAAIIYCDYRTIAKVFRIIISFNNNFFECMFENESNVQIQSLICSIFNMRVEKSFCIVDKDKEIELTSIISLFNKSIELFEVIDFDLKGEIIRLTDQLLRYNIDSAYKIIVRYNSETFFEHFSYYVFNSNDIEILNIYTECLINLINYALPLDDCDKIYIIENFDKELAEKFDDIMQSGEIDDEDTMHNISCLLEQVSVARESIED